MSYGILLLRLVVGVAFVGHGTQKLFGWFGGYGSQGTGSSFGSQGVGVLGAAAVVALVTLTLGRDRSAVAEESAVT